MPNIWRWRMPKQCGLFLVTASAKAVCPIPGGGEWFFFTSRDLKYPSGCQSDRSTTAGYWKATGKGKPVHVRLPGSSGVNDGKRVQTVIAVLKRTHVFYMGRAPGGDKTDWVMHEYRLADDSPVAGPAAAAAAHATAAESESNPAATAATTPKGTSAGADAAGGTAVGRASSRKSEAINPDTSNAADGSGDPSGGSGRNSITSSPKASSPKSEPGSGRRIGRTWVVVRVLKRSSLTEEEQELVVAKQAVVAQVMVKDRNEMVEQQTMVMQQQCGAPSPKGKPERDEEAPVAGHHAGLSVHGVHCSGDSPSLNSPQSNSPSTLASSLSPNSSWCAMPVDVPSSVVANREAAVGAMMPVGPEEEDASIVAKVAKTGAAEKEAVEAAPMKVEGTGAAVGADKQSSTSADNQPKSSRPAGEFLKGPLCPENLPSSKHYLFELKPPGSGRIDGGVDGGNGMGEQQQTEEEQQMRKEQKKQKMAEKLDWRVELDCRQEDGQKEQEKGD
ncbi:unnamed protein product [Closterium sp. Naga37s-1]|nr:unnamed protein product [Closterium sp. Naga37s-1]